MSDEYRHRGYQDDDRDRRESRRHNARTSPARRRAPAASRRTVPETSTCPGFARSSAARSAATPCLRSIGVETRCLRCGTDLHACSQCTSFDPGSRFECMEPALTARVSPKNARNTCSFYRAAARRSSARRRAALGRCAEGVRRPVQVLEADRLPFPDRFAGPSWPNWEKVRISAVELRTFARYCGGVPTRGCLGASIFSRKLFL